LKEGELMNMKNVMESQLSSDKIFSSLEHRNVGLAETLSTPIDLSLAHMLGVASLMPRYNHCHFSFYDHFMSYGLDSTDGSRVLR
jgi:hypothetical protein